MEPFSSPFSWVLWCVHAPVTTICDSFFSTTLGMSQVQAFLPLTLSVKGFKSTILFAGNTGLKKNAAPHHFFPFLKSSLLTPSWTWPCPCIRGFLGQIGNHLLEVESQANSHFSMCDPLLLASEWINLATVEVNTTFGLIISTLTWYEVWYYLLPAKFQLPLSPISSLSPPIPPLLLPLPPFLPSFPLNSDAGADST